MEMKREVMQKISSLNIRLGKLISSIRGISRTNDEKQKKKHAREAYFTCLQIERMEEGYDVSDIKEEIIPIIDNACYIENMERYLKEDSYQRDIINHYPQR